MNEIDKKRISENTTENCPEETLQVISSDTLRLANEMFHIVQDIGMILFNEHEDIHDPKEPDCMRNEMLITRDLINMTLTSAMNIKNRIY